MIISVIGYMTKQQHLTGLDEAVYNFIKASSPHGEDDWAIQDTNKYIKVLSTAGQGRNHDCVKCFIAKGDFRSKGKSIQKGDIFKPDKKQAPLLQFARGNVLRGHFWEGMRQAQVSGAKRKAEDALADDDDDDEAEWATKMAKYRRCGHGLEHRLKVERIVKSQYRMGLPIALPAITYSINLPTMRDYVAL